MASKRNTLSTVAASLRPQRKRILTEKAIESDLYPVPTEDPPLPNEAAVDEAVPDEEEDIEDEDNDNDKKPSAAAARKKPRIDHSAVVKVSQNEAKVIEQKLNSQLQDFFRTKCNVPHVSALEFTKG